MSSLTVLPPVEILDRRLTPVSAEIWVCVPGLEPGLEIRGRVTGPICRYSTTVEVAYPLYPGPREGAASTARTVIPEPCLWDPVSPFYYRVFVQLWQGETLLAADHFHHGLRRLQVGPTGFRCNGQPLTVRCISWEPDAIDDTLPTVEPARTHQRWEKILKQMQDLRGQGINVLKVAATAGSDVIWQLADQVGLFVLYEWSPQADDREQARQLARHGCGLGWVIPAEFAEHPALVADLREQAGRLLIGVPAADAVPPTIAQFVVADEERPSGSLPQILVRAGALQP